MRIIGGSCRGRRLVAPKGRQITRPTSDRVRESIFNIISQRIQDARVLDLYAGTGALGMEALSRGADFTAFVDKSLDACNLIKENIALLRFDDRSTIINRDLSRSGPLFLQGDLPNHIQPNNIQTNQIRANLSQTNPAKTNQTGAKKDFDVEKFDLVFMDPPYGLGLIEKTLGNTAFIDLLTDNALIVCEHCAQENPGTDFSNLDIRDQRKYGKTRITFLTFYKREHPL